jgi:putative ABC transport system permease protein
MVADATGYPWERGITSGAGGPADPDAGTDGDDPRRVAPRRAILVASRVTAGGRDVTFLGLVVHNVWAKRFRSLLTALAVAIGVSTILVLGIVTESLRTSAASILQVGKADFTVAQKGASEILDSVMTEQQLAGLQQTPGVRSAIGVLLDTEKLNDDNPLFVEIGIDPADLQPFGVTILRGRAFDPKAKDEMILGWRLAQDLGVEPGDTLDVAGGRKTVTGIFSTGNVFGDQAGMFPLIPFQAWERQPSGLSLAFLKVDKGASVRNVQRRITAENRNLTTIETVAQFGRADRNFKFITAADTAARFVAVIVGAIIVANSMLLSLLERTREFGVMRSIGWPRWRVVALVMSEAVVISFLGAALGVGLSVGVTVILSHVSSLVGILNPNYEAATFFRALVAAAAIGVLGALYPAIRVGFLTPREAMSRE